jgi:hypothetical protein
MKEGADVFLQNGPCRRWKMDFEGTLLPLIREIRVIRGQMSIMFAL